MHKFFFYNGFIIFLYMFRALLCSSSEDQIVLYSIWYHHTIRPILAIDQLNTQILLL